MQKTKEAEHRERLQDIKARVDDGKDQIATESALAFANKVQLLLLSLRFACLHIEGFCALRQEEYDILSNLTIELVCF